MGNPCAQIVIERKDEMSGKMKIVGIAVLAMMMVAGTAMAQGPGGWSSPAGGSHRGAHEMGPGPGGPGQQGGFGMQNLAQFRMMFRHIGLEEEQISAIEFITETAREEVMAIMEEAGRPDNRASFIEVFTSPTLTVSDLEETMGQMDEVRDEVKYVMFEAMVDIHDVLTAEQLEKLANLVEEHPHGMEHGPGMGSMQMR